MIAMTKEHNQTVVFKESSLHKAPLLYTNWICVATWQSEQALMFQEYFNK